MSEHVRKNSDYLRSQHWCPPWPGFRRWDNLDTFILALTLIWGGIVFIATNLGSDIAPWSIFFLGVGCLVLIEVGIRLLVSAYRAPILGDFVWAAVLFWLGDWNYIWPFALIAIGTYLIFKLWFRKRLIANP